MPALLMPPEKASAIEHKLRAGRVHARDPRAREERKGRGRAAVQEFGAELDRHVEARHAARVAAAADSVPRFQDQHRGARGRERIGRREAGSTGADDDDVDFLRGATPA